MGPRNDLPPKIFRIAKEDTEGFQNEIWKVAC